MFNKTIITVTTAVALGCMPIATNTLAADHPGGGHSGGHALSRHAMGGHAGGGYARGGQGARYGGGHSVGAVAIYEYLRWLPWQRLPRFRCPYVGGLINGVPGGY